MFRNPPRRTAEQVRAAIRATENRIAQLEAESFCSENYTRDLGRLCAELARAERRAPADQYSPATVTRRDAGDSSGAL